MKEEDIIANELGKITKEYAEPILNTLGLKLKAIDKATSIGAKMAFKYMPTETFKREIISLSDIHTTLCGIMTAITKIAELIKDDEYDSPYPCLSYIIRSGFLNMNPAVVHLEVIDVDKEGCRILVSAAAKEGLIKQKTAKKAGNIIVNEIKKGLKISEV